MRSACRPCRACGGGNANLPGGLKFSPSGARYYAPDLHPTSFDKEALAQCRPWRSFSAKRQRTAARPADADCMDRIYRRIRFGMAVAHGKGHITANSDIHALTCGSLDCHFPSATRSYARLVPWGLMACGRLSFNLGLAPAGRERGLCAWASAEK